MTIRMTSDTTTEERGRTAAVDPELLASARLEPATSLAVFRAVLAAASRPGSVVQLPDDVPEAIPAPLLPVLALADLEVRVLVLDDGAETHWSAVVEAATGARTAVAIGDADLVVARRPPLPAEVAAMRTGDAVAPERGARLIVACAAVGATVGPGVRVALSGPGAGAGRTVTIGGVTRDVVDAIAAAGAAFPAGIDAWFVAPDGAMTAILRSTTVDEAAEMDREGDR